MHDFLRWMRLASLACLSALCTRSAAALSLFLVKHLEIDADIANFLEERVCKRRLSLPRVTAAYTLSASLLTES